MESSLILRGPRSGLQRPAWLRAHEHAVSVGIQPGPRPEAHASEMDLDIAQPAVALRRLQRVRAQSLDPEFNARELRRASMT